MKIIKKILTQNDCYKSGKKIQIKGLMLHSFGTPQPSAEVMCDRWNKPGIDKCAHAILEPGIVYQTLPWDHRGWHAGGKANDNYIGVEMAEPDTIKYTNGANYIDLDPVKTKAFVLETYKTAVETFAFLCNEHKLDPLGTNIVISHSGGYKLGIASNHADVEHLWNRFGLSMAKFRKEVKAAMTSGEPTIEELVELLYSTDPQILSDKSKWTTKGANDKDIYWIMRKMVNYIKNERER
jgi:hypothetical protein